MKQQTKNKRSLPLRYFSWSNKRQKEKGEQFAEKTLLEWYEAKHDKASSEEIDFINYFCLKTCPYCDSKNTVKNGLTKNGIQRFLCKNCDKRFNSLTGTIFDSKRIPISEWIEFLIHLFEYHSIKSSAFDNRNADSTGRFWLKKVFLVLRNVQNNIVLDGTVYIDEKFFNVIKKDIQTKRGKKYRGLSRNKILVMTGVNKKSSFFFVGDKPKLTEASALKCYGEHIKSGSRLIHDMELSHNVVVHYLHLNSKTYDSKKLKKLPDEKNPLRPINKIHNLLERFISSHGGFKRAELQDWLNLFRFINNGPKDKYDKALLFIYKALISRNSLRFREAFNSKSRY